ncbi:glycogen/starch/alpha-glucan phosphorylase [Vallitalea okinawensis]|uniref:glycogen/starch/alpha-glucan phosphorylase n=1 Tax=Vallitalea okinawensis TaxID=2078660 RepID=UPI000CFE1C87|nr:glycogen/starch/alpha-glucan phosphorylase [Vallitalea okinawensis]
MLSNKEKFKATYLEKFKELTGDSLSDGNIRDKYMVLAKLIVDELNKNWAHKKAQMKLSESKLVYYFSIEFMIGKLLRQYLISLGVIDVVEVGLEELGISLSDLEQCEDEPGLGNGGLGRLAACFLDSMAFLGINGNGIGIRYKHGLFDQKIMDGYQVELPDNWLRHEFPWENRRTKSAVTVNFGGEVETRELNGKLTFEHKNYESVWAVPYDIAIAGYDNPDSINRLRLWSAEPTKGFDLKSFHEGNFHQAVQYKSSVEAISQVLYPNDANYEGRLLRLKQQYFFVSAGIQSIIRRYKKNHGSVQDFYNRIAIHINDTHPALCIPELMRIFIDEENLSWDQAWDYTTRTISYTNHTLLPEALERWPIHMVKTLMPRVYMIIEEINRRFLEDIHHAEEANMAILQHGQVHMAHLAIIGSYSVNGVAKIHSKILKNEVMKNFDTVYPDRFNNKTNGVDHRRFLLKANPYLSQLINETIGKGWIEKPLELNNLMNFQYDSSFRQKIFQAKQQNKLRLAKYIESHYDINIDPSSIFDIQVKRIHAYKRQLMNVLHIMNLYNQLKENPALNIHPRTFIFAGKAAPGYYYAKSIIKLINSLAKKINNDRTVNDKLKVIFLQNFNVSLAEIIYPAADISEQISTASKEASGTGNMKFMMNGAVTVATLDGANIEILDEVGMDNIFIFGLKASEVIKYYKNNNYKSYEIYHKDYRIQRILNQLIDGFFSEGDMEFRNIYESLLVYNDEFFVLKDFASYVDTQYRVNEKYNDRSNWINMTINNIAHSGYFSSDRTIKEYAKNIWNCEVNY